jgi:O-methyltransferase
LDIKAKLVCNLKPEEKWAYGMDKVRHGTTQLISNEIYQKNINGAIAELGVYKGFNASVLNYFFPDRKLYLFDTFSGFDSRDLEVEEQLGFKTGSYHDFSDTNIELVLSKMSQKENIIIRKGWFPESAIGLENEKFCFVTIDTDLYKPVYEGLCWFYPRLEEGGYIIVDDYNWNEYRGVKEAVHKFSREFSISYIPIPNATGSIVIGKPLKCNK